jgi:hypothetical protein
MRGALRLCVAAAALVAAGCTTLPSGPSLMALPGTGKDFNHFRADDAECRDYALAAIGGQTPSAIQEEAAARSAVAGALIGALAGAAINSAQGAAVGAGIGGAAGGLAGLGAAEASVFEAQRRYDHAYSQCMYAKGHRVPVAERHARWYGPVYYPPPAPLRYRDPYSAYYDPFYRGYPPPPPRGPAASGTPPPPPSGTGHPPPPPQYIVPAPR